MDYFRKMLGTIAGTATGIYLSLYFYLLSIKLNRECEFVRIAIVLILAGAALGYLFQRLLLWAENDKTVNSTSAGVWLPWIAVVPVSISLLTNFQIGGGPMGIHKYFLSSSWILGTIIYGYFLMKNIFKKFDVLKIACGFSILMLLLSASFNTYAPRESDECDYVAAGLSLLETGSMRVMTVIEDDSLNDLYFGDLPPTWAYISFMFKHNIVKTFNDYSLRMQGYPLILMPFLFIAKQFNQPNVRWFILGLPGVAAYFLLIYSLAALVLRRIGQNASAITSAAILTPFLYYTSNLQPEIFMTALIAFSLLLTDKVLSSENNQNDFFAGILIALIVYFHERMIIISFPWLIALSFLCKRRKRLILGYTLAFIPVIISYAALLQFKLPTHFHAYGAKGLPFFDFSRWMRAFYQHIFSIRIGILTHLPVMWIALIAFFDRKKLDSTARLSIFVSSIYFGVMVTYPHTFDSWPHLRYMIPIMPFLLLFVFDGCKYLESKGLRKITESIIILQLIRAFPFLVVQTLWRFISIY
ncbi:MAG: hypothetical protein COS94_04410 [Candidatus Hydrogenedentes bacterium CG07_land_8_20_14_0_80_42_17]|nr:MAG: hypothetical protein AUJ18_06130 [Candidatus Hydrogenedentes bacterium CG1_02_42_14]PIU47929.1 MAG: hypothetical protein COS94_04410 [Candidatus Hydrogenedentes bacterium CG07_land_8_20_14_0_80_42_17]